MSEAANKEQAFEEKVEAARVLADNLSGDAVDVKPHNMRWMEVTGWRAFEAFDCEECGREVVLTDLGETEHRHIEDEIELTELPKEGSTFKCLDCEEEFVVEYSSYHSPTGRGEDFDCPNCASDYYEGARFANNCDGYLHFEGPQMNYFYPADIGDCVVAARTISHLPLCVVQLEDEETGLALTGGGMDLSPDICKAYIALGYLPPAHFADLPRYVGCEKDQSWIEIITCGQRAAEVQKQWADNRLRHLDEMLDKMRTHAAKEQANAK